MQSKASSGSRLEKVSLDYSFACCTYWALPKDRGIGIELATAYGDWASIIFRQVPTNGASSAANALPDAAENPIQSTHVPVESVYDETHVLQN